MKSETLHPSSLILRTFFQKFDLFADAPDAVAKMREVVLEWAVQGRLVPQDLKDETAEALLDRVACRANTRRREADEPDETEAPFPIPETWQWVRLPRVLKKLTDGTHRSPPNGPTGAFMYVTAKNIKTDGVLLDGITYVSKKVHDEIYSRCDPSFGDVLYIKDGATTGIATINQVKEPFSMLSSVALLKPSHAIFSRYLLWAMRSPFFYKETRGAMKGAAITRVTLSVMAASLLPLPPLAEQKRIVAKVDELMAICDRLEAQQQERESRHSGIARASLARFAEAPTTANLNFIFHKSYDIPPADLRKSILTLAVQGKLVPQDPNDEPAEMTCAGLKQLSGESSDHAGIPDQWALCSYRSLTTLVTSGSRGWKQFYAEKGSIFIRTQNINTDKLILDDVAFVDLPRSAEERRAQVLIDDILITITGANVTKAARVEKHIPEAYVSQHIALTRPRWSKMSEWLHLCFVSHGSARGILEKVAYGDKPGLNLNNIRDLMLPIPPLAEQRRIVAKVDELMALVDALETQLDTSRTTAAKLLSALVAELTNL
jgi:type I restriction enzyme, S subunit